MTPGEFQFISVGFTAPIQRKRNPSIRYFPHINFSFPDTQTLFSHTGDAPGYCLRGRPGEVLSSRPFLQSRWLPQSAFLLILFRGIQPVFPTAVLRHIRSICYYVLIKLHTRCGSIAFNSFCFYHTSPHSSTFFRATDGIILKFSISKGCAPLRQKNAYNLLNRSGFYAFFTITS